MNPLEKFGIKKEVKPRFTRSLMYFMKEFGFNPLDEEYELEVNGKKIKVKKKGLSTPLFLSLLEELFEHYERERKAQEKANRKKW